jgi:hypothetical protein
MHGCHFPNEAVVDLAVFVRQSVALCHDGPPGDFGMGGFESVRNAARCFSNDFDLPFHGGAEE